MERKGLTDGYLDARGFVGQKPKFDLTQKGKTRVRFDISWGHGDESQGHYNTWCHCIAYGDIAERIRGVHVGSRVSIFGWISTEAVYDEYHKPVIENGKVKTEWHCLLTQVAVIEDRKNRQLPLVVGQASIPNLE